MKPEKTEQNKKEKKPNLVREKIKQNKILFYGLPALAVATIFGCLLFVILPSVQYFFTHRRQDATLNSNIINVNKSIQNLKTASADIPLINTYDAKLVEYIPKEHKLGDIINLIQQKADDFSLEKEIGLGTGGDRTSLGNIATTDEEQKAVFQSISSGELEFQPKSLDENTKAILLSIEVNVKGKKESFLNFLKDMDKVKPLINLVFIDYTESEADVESDVAVSAVLRFESYAVNLEEEDINDIVLKKYTSTDSALLNDIRVESFNWDQSIGENLE